MPKKSILSDTKNKVQSRKGKFKVEFYLYVNI